MPERHRRSLWHFPDICETRRALRRPRQISALEAKVDLRLETIGNCLKKERKEREEGDSSQILRLLSPAWSLSRDSPGPRF